jgi:hypothetical protein
MVGRVVIIARMKDGSPTTERSELRDVAAAMLRISGAESLARVVRLCHLTDQEVQPGGLADSSRRSEHSEDLR